MRVLIVNNSRIPAIKYGGTERVIWDLGQELNKMGHKVSYLVAKGSSCPFAEHVYDYDETIDLNKQIPENIDIVHLNFQPSVNLKKPYLCSFHGNTNTSCEFDKNTVFISANQASRFHGSIYVHNGLDWDNYPKPKLDGKRAYFHFLADASWKVKNVRGAIEITKKAKEKLVVLGGNRINFNMGFRFTPNLHVRFKGDVDNTQKAQWLSGSKGLIFPVLWHEPFGLAIIESMYYGCPVFGTTYGSLPELVLPQLGVLSNSINVLASALKCATMFSPKQINEYAVSYFNSLTMCTKYVSLYEQVLNGHNIHESSPYFANEEIVPKRFSMTE